MTYSEIRKNEEVLTFIKKGNANLGAMGFTDHSEAHSGPGADRVRYRIAWRIYRRCHRSHLSGADQLQIRPMSAGAESGRRIRQPSINMTASIMRLQIRSLRSMWRREWFHWICRLIRRSAACMSILRYSLDVWWCVSVQRKCWRHPLSWPWTDPRCCKLRVSEENCI